LLVKVTTDQGLEGWGEAFGFRAVRSTKLAIEELIAPLCIGKDAMQIVPLIFLTWPAAVPRRQAYRCASSPLFEMQVCGNLFPQALIGTPPHHEIRTGLSRGAVPISCQNFRFEFEKR
jgi:Mandelate racemase / muconate lactonizing enzyme, N-terminal domain